MRTPLINLIFFIFSSFAYSAEVIGLPLPLEGRLAPIGESLMLGAKAAADDLNAQGETVKLVFSENGCASKKVDAVAQKMDEARVEIIVGAVCFEVAQQLATRLSKPVVTLDTQKTGLERLRTVEKLPIYEISTSHNGEAQAVLEHVFPRFDGKPFAILDDGSVYGRGLSDALRLLGEQAGYKPVVVDNFRPLQTTQISTLRRLEKSGVQALFVIGGADDLVTFARDMKKLKYNWTVGSGSRADMLEYTSGFLDVPQGWFSVKEITPQISIELIEKLYEAPILAVAAKGYVMVQLAAQAERDLADQSFETVLGPIKFGGDGRATIGEFVLHQWDGRRFVPEVNN